MTFEPVTFDSIGTLSFRPLTRSGQNGRRSDRDQVQEVAVAIRSDHERMWSRVVSRAIHSNCLSRIRDWGRPTLAFGPRRIGWRSWSSRERDFCRATARSTGNSDEGSRCLNPIDHGNPVFRGRLWEPIWVPPFPSRMIGDGAEGFLTT